VTGLLSHGIVVPAQGGDGTAFERSVGARCVVDLAAHPAIRAGVGASTRRVLGRGIAHSAPSGGRHGERQAVRVTAPIRQRAITVSTILVQQAGMTDDFPGG
jgi:hypothetical protein